MTRDGESETAPRNIATSCTRLEQRRQAAPAKYVRTCATTILLRLGCSHWIVRWISPMHIRSIDRSDRPRQEVCISIRRSSDTTEYTRCIADVGTCMIGRYAPAILGEGRTNFHRAPAAVLSPNRLDRGICLGHMGGNGPYATPSQPTRRDDGMGP